MLDNIIGVEEAADLWGLSPGYVKNLCAHGKIHAKKIGKTWVIDKAQENPSHRKNHDKSVFREGVYGEEK